MAQQTIFLGTFPDDGTGDTLRDGGDKINDNFDELYPAVALNTAKVTNATHSGDATGSGALTLATVNANVGTFDNVSLTVNGKGLITGCATTAHTGDATGATALTLATVNASPGTYTAATITVNGKGLVTSASSTTGSVINKYSGTVNLGAGVVTQKVCTGVTTKPYSIQLCDSSDNLITHAVSIELTIVGADYALNIYSGVTLNNVDVKILY